MRRRFPARSALLVAFLVTLLSSGRAGAVEYRNLVLICRNVVIPELGYDYHLSDQEVADTREAFEVTWPKRIAELSGGQVTIRNTVAVIDEPITSCWKLRERDERPCIWPDDMPPSVLQDYCRPGWYDAVINYNAIPEFEYVTSGGFEPKAGDASWMCLGKVADFDPTHDPLSGWTHEWLHTWEAYYYHFRHYDGGKNSWVHDGAAAGYKADDDGMHFWWAWYHDLMMGRLPNGSGGFNGFGPDAWKQFKTPRSRFEDVGRAFDAETVYRLTFSHDGLALTVADDGAPVVQAKYAEGDGQKFHVLGNNDGTYRIVSVRDDLAVSVPKSGRGLGAVVTASKWRGTTNQKWSVNYAGNGVYSLESAFRKGGTVGMPDDSTAEGDSPKMWKDIGGRNQQLFITPSR